MDSQQKADETWHAWAKRHKRLVELFFFIFLSLIWLVPWLFTGRLFTGDDLGFHLNRIQGIYQQFSTGKWIIPKVATTTFTGWGYPINLFYPAYTIVPVAIMQFLFGGVVAFYIFLFVLNMATLYVAAFVGEKILKDRFQGIFVAILYSFAHYRLIDFFVRGALAESIVFLFLPLVLYGIYSIAYGDFKKWYWLAIGMALIALTHVLSIVLATVMVILLSGLFFLRKSDLGKRIRSLVWSILMTILLSIVFLGPLIEQLKSMGNMSMAKYNLADSHYSILKLVTYSLTNRMNSLQVNIGLIFLLLIAISLVEFKKFSKSEKYLFVVGIVFLVMSTTLFPWKFFQPILGFIQFSWRFLALATLLFAITGTKALFLLCSEHNQIISRGLLLELSVIIVALISVFSYASYVPNTKTRSLQPSDYHWLATSDITTDYVRPHSLKVIDKIRTHSVEKMNERKIKIHGNRYFKAHGRKRVRRYKMHATVKQNQRVVKSDGFVYRVRSVKDQQIKIPNLMYKGYVLLVNGHRQRIETNRADVVLARVTKGANTIVFKYVPTRVQQVSKWVSLVTWAVGIFAWLFGAMRRKSQKAESAQPITASK